MSGNICRCGAYSSIVDAITEVAGGGDTRNEDVHVRTPPASPARPARRPARTPARRFVAGGIKPCST
jgi:xanthine dehydrogenase iron-sulfur cluster and FAD-binding subunit A